MIGILADGVLKVEGMVLHAGKKCHFVIAVLFVIRSIVIAQGILETQHRRIKFEITHGGVDVRKSVVGSVPVKSVQMGDGLFPCFAGRDVFGTGSRGNHSFTFTETFKVVDRVFAVTLPELHHPVAFGRAHFGEEDLIPEEKPLAVLHLHDKGAVVGHRRIHETAEDLPLFHIGHCRQCSGPDCGGGIVHTHSFKAVGDKLPVDHFLRGNVVGNTEKSPSGIFHPGLKIGMTVKEPSQRGRVTVDQQRASRLLRKETGIVTPPILVHDPADTAVADKIMEPVTVVFNVIIDTALADDEHIHRVIVVLFGVIHLLNAETELLFQKSADMVLQLEPVLPVTDPQIAFHLQGTFLKSCGRPDRHGVWVQTRWIWGA